MKKALKTILIFGGVALLGYGFYYYYHEQSALLAGVKITPQSVVLVGDITSTNVSMQINIAVSNPSNIAVTVNTIFVNIFVNGILLGTAQTAAPFVIPSMNSDGSAGVNIGQLQLVIDPSKLLNVSSALSIISLKGVNVVVNGFANVTAFPAHLQIPVNFTQALTL